MCRSWWGNKENSVSLDITDAFIQVGDFEDISNLQAWGFDEVPGHNDLNKTDHHDNLVRRIELLPRNYRGNVLRKMIAYQNLQTILKGGKKIKKKSVHNANVTEAAKIMKSRWGCL